MKFDDEIVQRLIEMIERLRPGAEQMAREMSEEIKRIKNGEYDSNQRS